MKLFVYQTIHHTKKGDLAKIIKSNIDDFGTDLEEYILNNENVFLNLLQQIENEIDPIKIKIMMMNNPILSHVIEKEPVISSIVTNLDSAFKCIYYNSELNDELFLQSIIVTDKRVSHKSIKDKIKYLFKRIKNTKFNFPNNFIENEKMKGVFSYYLDDNYISLSKIKNKKDNRNWEEIDKMDISFMSEQKVCCVRTALASNKHYVNINDLRDYEFSNYFLKSHNIKCKHENCNSTLIIKPKVIISEFDYKGEIPLKNIIDESLNISEKTVHTLFSIYDIKLNELTGLEKELFIPWLIEFKFNNEDYAIVLKQEGVNEWIEDESFFQKIDYQLTLIKYTRYSKNKKISDYRKA